MKTKMTLIVAILFAGITFSSFQKDKSNDILLSKSYEQSTEMTYQNNQVTVPQNDGIVSQVMLSSYPNPFKQKTMIMFEVVNSGWVLLEVRNELKQYSVPLVNGYLKEGYHRIEFDGTRHTPGRYTIVLTMGNLVVTESLIKVADDSSGLANGQ